MKRFLFSELCKKEVICDGDGKKLGYPSDVELDKCGSIQHLIVPCRGGLWLFSSRGHIRIPWCDVIRIGIDVIWVCGCHDSYKKTE